MGKTAGLFDAEGLELGSHPVEIDPNRVPAKAPAGKKEKQRRRKAAKKRSAGEPDARGSRPRRTSDMTRAEAAAAVGEQARKAADETTSKPSRRKRGGKTRVRGGEEPGDVELLSAREARSTRNAQDPARSEHKERGNRRRTYDGARDERGFRDTRSERSRSRNRPERPGTPSREAWRNFDEPVERTRRGRGVAPRPNRTDKGSTSRRSTRRPGDHGGRR